MQLTHHDIELQPILHSSLPINNEIKIIFNGREIEDLTNKMKGDFTENPLFSSICTKMMMGGKLISIMLLGAGFWMMLLQWCQVNDNPAIFKAGTVITLIGIVGCVFFATWAIFKNSQSSQKPKLMYANYL